MAKQPKDDRIQQIIHAIEWVASEISFDGKKWKSLADEMNNRGIKSVTSKTFSPDGLRSFCTRNKVDFTKIRTAINADTLLQHRDPDGMAIMRLESKLEILKAAQESVHPFVKDILSRQTEAEEDSDINVVDDTTPDHTTETAVVPPVVNDTTEEHPIEVITVGFDEVEPYNIPQVTTPEVSDLDKVGVVEIPEVFSPVPEPLPQLATQLPQWLLDDMDNLRTLLEWWKTQGSAPQLHEMERRPIFRGKTRNTGIRINTEILDRAVDKSKKEKNQTGGNLSQLVEWLMWRYLGEPLDVVEGSEAE